jgi:hypothetical protein
MSSCFVCEKYSRIKYRRKSTGIIRYVSASDPNNISAIPEF